MSLPAVLAPAALLLAPLVTPAPSDGGSGEPVLRLSGHPISAEEYGDWLVRQRGPLLADTFSRAMLIDAAATDAGHSATPEEVSASVEQEFEERVAHAFGGDRDRWTSELRTLGRTERGLRLERSLEHRTQILLDALLAENRRIPESALRRAWRREYGADGIIPRVRVIHFEAGTSRRSRRGADAERMAEEAARARAEAAHARLLAGAEFERVAREESEDDASRLEGGLAPADFFTSSSWPHATTLAVDALAPGEFTGPVRGPDGFWILQLVERVETSFESVRDELEAELLDRPPGPEETGLFLEDLYGSFEPNVLPAMHRDPGPLEPSLPQDEPVLEVRDRKVTRGEYADWIMRYRGEDLVERFALWWEIERLAAEANVDVTPEEVAERVESDRRTAIDTSFGGREDAWAADLERMGRTPESWHREAMLRTRSNLLSEKLLIREREITDEAVRRAWHERHGEDGVGLYLRSLLVRPEPPALEAGMEREEIRELTDAAFEEARRQAGDLARRARAGEDFGALARQYSDDEETRESGGRMEERFRPHQWPAEASEAVLALEPGGITDPVRFADAYVLFELLERREVPFEEVKDELREELRTARPTEPELAAFQNLAQQGVKVEILPALYE